MIDIRKIISRFLRPQIASPEYDIDVRTKTLVKQSLKEAFSFAIDVVDACNIRCVGCPRGVYYGTNTSKKMDVCTFERLLNKIVSTCKCRQIELHNWTDPFLHPQLDKIVELVKAKNIYCVISTNFSFKKDSLLQSVLRQAPVLVVSVSGFTEEVQQRYHRGSNLDSIKKNLEFVANFREKEKTSLRIEVHCLQFTDNQEDQSLWERFCHEHNFIFNPKPACASEVTTLETAKRLLYPPSFESFSNGEDKVFGSFSQEPRFDFCPLHNNIPINVFCDIYLCCVYWNRDCYNMGNYFDLSLDAIQQKRLSHKHCLYCISLRNS